MFDYKAPDKYASYAEGIKSAIADGVPAEQVFSYLKTKNPDLEQELRKEYVMTSGYTKSKFGTKLGGFLGSMFGIGGGAIKTASNVISLLPGVDTKPVVNSALDKQQQQLSSVFGESAGQSFATGQKVGSGIISTAMTLPVGGPTSALVKGQLMKWMPSFLAKSPMTTKAITGVSGFLGGSLAESETFKVGMTGGHLNAEEGVAGVMIDSIIRLPGWSKGIWNWAKNSGKSGEFLKNMGEVSGMTPQQIAILSKPENKQVVTEMMDIAEAGAKDTSLPNVFESLGKDSFDKFKTFKTQRSGVGKIIGNTYKNSTSFIDTAPVKQTVYDALDNLNVGVVQPKTATLFGTEVAPGKLDFTNSAISNPSDQEALQFLYDKVTGLPDATASYQGWILRQNLDNFIDGKAANEAFSMTHASETPFIKAVDDIVESLNKANPGLATLNKEYSQMSGIYLYLNKKFGAEGAKSSSLIKSLLGETVDARTKGGLQAIYQKAGTDIVERARIADLAQGMMKSSGGSEKGWLKTAGEATLKTIGVPDKQYAVMQAIMWNANKKAIQETGKALSNEQLIKLTKITLSNLLKTGTLSSQQQ